MRQTKGMFAPITLGACSLELPAPPALEGASSCTLFPPNPMPTFRPSCSAWVGDCRRGARSPPLLAYAQDFCSSLPRMTSTEQGANRTTFSATLTTRSQSRASISPHAREGRAVQAGENGAESRAAGDEVNSSARVLTVFLHNASNRIGMK